MERFGPVAKLNVEFAIHAQEQLVMRVAVPVELAFQLGDADLVTFIARHDARRPVFGERAELFGQGHLARHQS